MRVILSRKGFDSTYGGFPSPIIEKRTLLSLPIPGDEPSDECGCSITYDELKYNGVCYAEMIESLSGGTFRKEGRYCHLDPDIRKDIRKVPENWQAAFGQVNSAQGHLEKQNVGIDDLFLFFGLYKNAKWSRNKLVYDAQASRKHIIFGYLQIGKIVKGEEIKSYYWHPHSKGYTEENNTIYVASDKLVIDGEDTGLNGYGTFNYSEDLVLTKENYSCTEWMIPDFFREVTMTYHSSKSFKDGYFQSASRGQEFVISENGKVTDWAKKLILENIDTENH